MNLRPEQDPSSALLFPGLVGVYLMLTVVSNTTRL
jgi:hypothetical protein